MKKAIPSVIGICCIILSNRLSAAEPVKLEWGGYANLWVGYAANRRGRDYFGNNIYGNNYPVFNSAENTRLAPPPFDAHEDAEVDVTGATRLDNGLRIMASLDLSPTVNKYTANSQNKLVKRVYAAASGDFGSISAGDRENIGQILHNSAPDITGIGGQDGFWWNWVLPPTGHRGLQRSYVGDDLTSAKVLYLTPSVYGLAGAVSYTPSIKAASGGIPSSYTGAGAGFPADGGDLSVYALTFRQDFASVGSVKADLGISRGNAGMIAVQSGVKLTYAGLTFGSSFLRRDVSDKAPAVKDFLAQGYAWDAGLAYAIAGYSLAANAFAERAAKGNLTNAAAMAGAGPLAALGSTSFAYDRDEVYAVEGMKRLNSSITLNATVFHVAYHDAYGVAAEQNQGWGALSGVAIKF